MAEVLEVLLDADHVDRRQRLLRPFQVSGGEGDRGQHPVGHLVGGQTEHLHHVVVEQRLEPEGVVVDLLQRLVLVGGCEAAMVAQERECAFDRLAQHRKRRELRVEQFDRAQRKVAEHDADLVSTFLPTNQELVDRELRCDREHVAVAPVGVDRVRAEPAIMFERNRRVAADAREQVGAAGLLHVHEEPPLLLLRHGRYPTRAPDPSSRPDACSMEPFDLIHSADFAPRVVLELSDGPLPSAPAYPDAETVRLDDREGWGSRPDSLGEELDRLLSPIDLVLDHAADGPGLTVATIFEVVFARRAPGAPYVIDGVLPSSVILELMFGSVVSPDLIDTVSTTVRSTVVRRGPRDPSTDRVALREVSSDPFGIIV